MLIPPLLLVAASLADAAATPIVPATSMNRRSLGDEQRARFERRLVALSATLDRQRAMGMPPGRAAFIRQDIARVADGVASVLRVQGYLNAGEDRSYTAMMGQITRKLARAQAEHQPVRIQLARR